MYTAKNVLAPEKIHESLNEIQGFLDAHFNADNPSACVDRAVTATAYMGLSSKLFADAKYHYNTLVQSAVMTAIKQASKSQMTTSTINKYIEALTADYRYLVDWADRINAACTHNVDLMRSLISKHKEEMKASQIGGNTR